MRRIARQIRLAFVTLLAIILALIFPLFQVYLDFGSLSAKYVALNAFFAVLISLGVTLLLIALYAVLVGFLGTLWRHLLAKITLYVLARAVDGYGISAQATSIGERSGSVVLRLEVGPAEPISVGDKFSVVNSATRDRWGVVEVIEVQGNSCLCSVFDRINEEFWEQLESRMRRDPSPPAGVAFSREVPAGLLAGVREVLQRWGG